MSSARDLICARCVAGMFAQGVVLCATILCVSFRYDNNVVGRDRVDANLVRRLNALISDDSASARSVATARD